MKQTVSILFLLLLTITSCSNENSREIKFKALEEGITFYDQKSKNNFQAIFLLNEDKSRIKISGEWMVADKDLLFIPDLPLIETANYIFKTKDSETLFQIETPGKKKLEITKTYPTSNILPENLLRMYIEFSNPMKTKGNIENIKLINQEGKEIKGAIFNNVHELWDSSQTQLTIIFDPSRVKTGLKANNSLGRALQPNQKYKLVISNVTDIYGQKLNSVFSKEFDVIHADFNAPNVANWKISKLKNNTRENLKIIFPEEIDKMSLLNRIIVVNEKASLVPGKISIENGEKEWVFTPKKPWNEEKYYLKINSRLEDPSGNNLNGLFDHKVGELKNDSEGKIISIPLDTN